MTDSKSIVYESLRTGWNSNTYIQCEILHDTNYPDEGQYNLQISVCSAIDNDFFSIIMIPCVSKDILKDIKKLFNKTYKGFLNHGEK